MEDKSQKVNVRRSFAYYCGRLFVAFVARARSVMSVRAIALHTFIPMRKSPSIGHAYLHLGEASENCFKLPVLLALCGWKCCNVLNYLHGFASSSATAVAHAIGCKL